MAKSGKLVPPTVFNKSKTFLFVASFPTCFSVTANVSVYNLNMPEYRYLCIAVVKRCKKCIEMNIVKKLLHILKMQYDVYGASSENNENTSISLEIYFFLSSKMVKYNYCVLKYILDTM